MSNIHLILISPKNHSTNWGLGEIYYSENSVKELIRTADKLTIKPDNDFILFWNNSQPLPNKNDLLEVIQSPGHVWHAGLHLDTSTYPKIINYLQPNWMLTINPEKFRPSTSWKLNLNAAIIKIKVIKEMGFLSKHFKSVEGGALELGYNWIKNGVIVRNHPKLYSKENPETATREQTPISDEILFSKLHFPYSWIIWVFIRHQFNPVFPRWDFIKEFIKSRNHIPLQSPIRFKELDQALSNPLYENHKVSLLIPTLNRYPYLKKLLHQIERLDPPPFEIIIIDQSSPQELNKDFYSDFRNLPLVIEYQEKPGQCSSRNRGLQLAKGDYILFLDDDDEISKDLIQLHLNNLILNKADASCGIAHEIGIPSLPKDFTYPRVSDVFPTNNTMVRKNIFKHTGLFDLAYNKGSRADADLGTRIYLNGALMILNPKISVIHHHAPSGGLRTHKARIITYHSSRTKLLHRHIPSITEIYKSLRYFTPFQTNEMIWVFIFSTFQGKGRLPFRIIKLLVGALLFPSTYFLISKRLNAARSMLKKYPQTPHFIEHQ